MNDDNKQEDIELIGKYLAGEASPREAMELHGALNDHQKKDEYDKLVQLWSSLSTTSHNVVPPVEEEWAQLEKKLKSARALKVRKLLLYRAAIAASLIGLMFISYTLFFPGRKEQIAQQNEQRNVVETATRDIRNLALPDGSTITLNKYSSVAYSGAFVKKREMVLKGEAFFNVVQNKTNPFIITVDELKIRVVGTSFNVRNLSDGGGIEVQVETGVVKMYTAQNELTVKKGETGLFNKAHGELELKDAINVNSLGYATKTFSFNDLSFVEACRYLEPAFNVIIKIDPNKFSDCRLTAQFNNQSLDYILEIINATLNCSYKKQGNTIYIIGEGCK